MWRCTQSAKVTKELKHKQLRLIQYTTKTPKPNSTFHFTKTHFLSTSTKSLPQIGDLLLVAFITKTLKQSGTRNLNQHEFPLSDHIILQILSRPSLGISEKLDFFRWCSHGHNYKHSASTYARMFYALSSVGWLQEVPTLLNSMKNEGVIVGSDTFKVMFDSFIKVGQFGSALDILDCMEELGVNLKPRMYGSVIVALVKTEQVGSALSIFNKIFDVSNGDGDHDLLLGSIACNALLVGLRKEDKKDEFKMVFDKLRRGKGFVFDIWGYNICIHTFGCWGDVGTSLRLFKEMKEKSSVSGSCSPDLCTYNSLIHVLCLAGKVEDALIVYEELKVSGHEPDAFTYRILIHGCCKSYRINDATAIFSTMQYNGFVPDTAAYNSLLDGMFKARKVIEACKLFESMVQDGIRASCWTYNILIDGLFRNGRAGAGYTLFCDLKKKGQFVDAITYSIVMLQLCREGELKEALSLVEEMEQRGLIVDLVTITSLLIGLHKHGMWDSTERLMKHIRDGDLLPGTIKWKADMDALLENPPKTRENYVALFPRKGNLSDIMDSLGSPDIGNNEKSLFSEDLWSSSPHMDLLADKAESLSNQSQVYSLARALRVQSKGIDSFDIDMVNTFVSIILAKGKLSLACKLFEIFQDMGVNPVSYTYNSIMSSFVKKGYFNEAWDVFNEMDEKLCPADIATYNVIIQGLGKMGRADLASSVLDQLTKQGGYIDVVMYNTLINALGKAGRIQEANSLFAQMKSSGMEPDVVTYNTMIEVHSKCGHLKGACRFLKMMLNAGCTPNHVTDTTMDFLTKEMDRLRHQKASIIRGKDDPS